MPEALTFKKRTAGSLDCGYVLTKRKGKGQELRVHPFVKVVIPAVRIRSLDDLVRQLNKEFDKLKFYGENVHGEVILEEFLPRFIESDVYTKDQDVNFISPNFSDMFRSFSPLLRKSESLVQVQDSIIIVWTIRHSTHNCNYPITKAEFYQVISPQAKWNMYERVMSFFYYFPLHS